MPNNQLVEELHKSIIRKCKKQRVHSSFKDKIWGAYLADMQLISKYNKGFRFLLCVVDIFGKYPWFLNVVNMRKIFQLLALLILNIISRWVWTQTRQNVVS